MALASQFNHRDAYLGLSRSRRRRRGLFYRLLLTVGGLTLALAILYLLFLRPKGRDATAAEPAPSVAVAAPAGDSGQPSAGVSYPSWQSVYAQHAGGGSNLGSPATVEPAEPSPAGKPAGEKEAAPVSRPAAATAVVPIARPQAGPVSPTPAAAVAAPVVRQPPAAVASPATMPSPAASGPTSPSAAEKARQGMALIDEGKLVEARSLLSQLLVDPAVELSASDAGHIREALARVNQELVFSARVRADDPLAEGYVIQSGDLLLKIAPRYKTTYQFIEKVNGIDARRIRVGQRIKCIKGPFHAVVHKSAFRMDVFLKDPAGSMVYIRSFPVGLGEGDSTPEGAWLVRTGSKMSNPSWTNPRTGEFFAGDNPKNPIGEHWLGLEGVDDKTRELRGYGIHGTIEPDSIGKQASMGCVRMLSDDIALVYAMLIEGHSTVVIRR